MKGDRKRRKSTFKKGHTVNKDRKTIVPKYREFPVGKHVRMDKRLFENTVVHDEGQMYLVDEKGMGTPAKLLRPRSPKATITQQLNEEPTSGDTGATSADVIDETATVNLKKVEDMVNKVLIEHFEITSQCTKGPDLRIKDNISWGLSRRIRWECKNCEFTSKTYKLYKEVIDPNAPPKRGCKAADVNVGLATGLASSSIGVAGVSDILHSMNQPSPQKSSLRKHLNRAYARIKQLNEDDMTERREEIRKLQELKGLGADHPIRAQGDGRYNNRLGSGGSNPFQSGTQTSYVIAESETRMEQVITLSTFNQLCHSCRILKSKGIDVVCPGGSPGCTANLAMDETIGDEKRGAKAAIENMKQSKVNIGVFTSDGDSQAFQGIKEAQPTIHAENVRDTRHFKQTHRRNIKKHASEFSSSMMPVDTDKWRKKLEKRLADDLSERCQAEAKGAFKSCGPDEKAMKNALHLASEAIVSCYEGDHTLCVMHSFVCGGTDETKWTKPHLPEDMKDLDMTDEDKGVIRQMIKFRIGPAAVSLTRYNTTSQKSEAVNRAINKMNPKDITKSRNFEGSVHSAVLNVNNRKSNAIAMKAEAMGVPITPRSRVARQLLAEDKQDLKEKHRQKTSKFKQARYQRQMERYKLYDAKHNLDTDTYKKDLLDADIIETDHNYARNKTDNPTSAQNRIIVPCNHDPRVATGPRSDPSTAFSADVSDVPHARHAPARVKLRRIQEKHVMNMQLGGPQNKTVKISVLGKRD